MDVQQLGVTEAASDETYPSALWAGAPSLAATTVAMTNTSGRRIMAYVGGGTVTVVKVNNITTGLIAGGVLLKRGDTIAITYSSAPTLKWFYA